MPKIDLDKLSREDLVQLRKDVDKAITSFDERRRQEALAAVEAKAKEMGFSLNELTQGQGAKKTKAALPPKYRHPENPAKTWSGRGRQPAWIKEGLDQGKSLDDFLIE